MKADPNEAVAAVTEYAADDLYPKWVAGLAIVGGVSTTMAGVVMAYTGFSELTMAISVPASSLVLVWMLTVGVFMWRRGGVSSVEARRAGA
jgi:hypothetical protein